MRERITLNRREQTRAKVLTIVIEGRCTAAEAAGLLGVSERHLFRLKKAFREEGPGGLAHGNRGRRPRHAIAAETRDEVLRLASSLYHDYNHTHLQEELAEEHGITLSRRTVARILTTAGLRSPRRRRSPKHRSRREPSAKEGMLWQIDGSQHDWLEGRGSQLTLLGAVDDASGEIVHALFREHEDAQGYFTLLRDGVRQKGIPVAWYTDRHGVFSRNDKEAWTLEEDLAGRREPTQVTRALEELGITLILARSPQAKGRVERCWGTLQDRLVKELRKAGASTVQDANRVLKAYLPRFRKRFARKPADPHSAYRPLPKELDLAGICSFHYVRRVANDNTVRLEEHLVQVPRGPAGRSYAGCQVQLQERLDGSLAILYQGRLLVRTPSVSGTTLRNRRRARGRELPAAIFPSPPQTTPRRPRNTTSASSKPSTIHPWRNSLLTKSPTG